jgi:hypothetical protein
VARISKSARACRALNVERAVSRAGQLIRERLRGQSPAELHLHPSQSANRVGRIHEEVPERSPKIDVLRSRSELFHVNGAAVGSTPSTMRIQGASRAHPIDPSWSSTRAHWKRSNSAISQPNYGTHDALGTVLCAFDRRVLGRTEVPTPADPRKRERRIGQAVSPPASRKRAIRSAGT